MTAVNQQERLPQKERELKYYLAGFMDGEASFNVSFKPHPAMKLGWVVDPAFQVYQHRNNVAILELISRVLHCGTLRRKSPTSDVMVLVVDNRRTLMEKIVPFFTSYRLISNKQKDFEKFREVLLLMEKKAHLDLQGFVKIVEIATSMNAQGKQRTYSKEFICSNVAKSSETTRQVSVETTENDIVRTS
jgi:hypothetical protein